MQGPKRCAPDCPFFRCGQRAAVRRGSAVYCRFADDECKGPACKYAMCAKNRMLADGLCGLTIRRAGPSLVEIPPEEAVGEVRVRGKVHPKLRREELF